MRLIPFLSDLERALIAQSPVVEGGAWETHRMVNFHYGLARLTVSARPGVEMRFSGGTVFLQSFVLADGSLCLKASLNWNGSDALPVYSIYPTSTLNWKAEASRMAALWLAGPPSGANNSSGTEVKSQNLPPVQTPTS
jgi:hypothetical protein